jgi:hypothetical protein
MRGLWTVVIGIVRRSWNSPEFKNDPADFARHCSSLAHSGDPLNIDHPTAALAPFCVNNKERNHGCRQQEHGAGASDRLLSVQVLPPDNSQSDREDFGNQTEANCRVEKQMGLVFGKMKARHHNGQQSQEQGHQQAPYRKQEGNPRDRFALVLLGPGHGDGLPIEVFSKCSTSPYSPAAASY